MTLPATFKQMISTVSENGTLTMKLRDQDMPKPESDQVIVRVEATPINPSDHGVMFGWASMASASSEGSGADTVLSAPVSPQGMGVMKARIGQDLIVGNEGAGTVVAAGDSEYAQSLIGNVVAIMGGGMYAQYRCLPAAMCMPLLPDCTAKDGASSFVNPLTALSFLDDTFMKDLTDSIHETGATLGFDATGGGDLASTILSAMEAAAARTPGAYSIYGSIKHKQVYLYGGLDVSPTKLNRGYGMAWGVGGWLLPNFLAKVGMDVGNRLRTRVAKELKTTFASHYTDEISLGEALNAETVARYNAKTTGEKFLICPQKEM